MVPAQAAESTGQLAKAIEDYLGQCPTAAVLEDGGMLFDMRSAKYAISDAHGRCVLQI